MPDGAQHILNPKILTFEGLPKTSVLLGFADALPSLLAGYFAAGYCGAFFDHSTFKHWQTTSTASESS